MNGHAKHGASRAHQVQKYLDATAEVVTEWIKRGEGHDTPVTRHASGYEAREKVTLSLSEDGVSDEDVFAAMRLIVNNSVNPWTGRFVDKLYTAPLPLGIAAETLLAAINANAHVMSASPMLCLAEEACVTALAGLCGWDTDMADGITMPGGSSSNTLALQTALNNLFPRFSQEGVDAIIAQGVSAGRSSLASRPLIFTSAEGHYSIDKAAIACGLGLKSVVKVRCDAYGRMDPETFEQLFCDALADTDGTKTSQPGIPIFVNATAGSTVMGAFDPIGELASSLATCTSRFAGQSGVQRPWLHVDGSWGGPIIFSKTHRDRMKGIEHCDSLTINPHKLLNVPLQCSFALFRNGDALSANALDAPYLFHDSSNEVPKESDDGQDAVLKSKAAAIARKHKRRESPAQLNFGCGRRGDALKMYLLWLSKGTDYFGQLVDEGIERALQIIEHVQRDNRLCQALEVAPLPESMYFLQVCVRPRLGAQSDVEARSKSTRDVHERLRHGKHFAVDFAPLGQGKGEFIRIVTHPSTPLSAFVDLLCEIADIGDTLPHLV